MTKFRALSSLVLAGVTTLGSPVVIPQTTHAQPAQLSLGFDDLMTLLIQPRHTKLYYAGIENNWELAAAESRDLRAAFTSIAATIPRYLNNGVGKTLNSMMVPKIDAIDAVIATADSKKFAATYKDLTAACNACHAFVEHPFIVVKIPELNATAVYPDQDFRATP